MADAEVIQEVSRTVKAVLAEWIERGDASDARDVNHAGGGGSCLDFAEEVMAQLPDWTMKRADISDFGVSSVQQPGPDGCAGEISGAPFDRDLLARYWPDCVPPEGLDWDDLDRVSERNDFDAMSHWWIACDDVHFDAECPEGTRNFFELPWMQRAISFARQPTP